ncbi:MAG: glycosyltransferase family 9 protein [Gemmataceae bacterium]|nr:glycosyltransferase family 9 protein [Gemmataceae bacterium]MDW8263716.1 glycosyltransferase family 9 protein [Gemmataceae bacterium]
MPRLPLTRLMARRIALIKPSALGDIVHSLPVLTAVRRRFPRAHITWVVNRSYEALLRGHPDLDETLPFDRGASRRGVWQAGEGWFQFLGELRRRRFDLVIDLQGLLRTGLMTAATGARRRLGLSSAREGAGWFYTDVVRDADHVGSHAVDRYWRVAEALGVGEGPKEFRLPSWPEARDWARRELANWPRPWLMVGVGARWPTKRWPAEHFAALARRALGRFGGTVVLVGGRDEVPLSRTVAALLPGRTLDLTGRTTLPRLAAVLAAADVMVANDTGPLHLAVALGRRVVAPYTCTQVRLTGPYGAEADAVESRVWCQGSCRKTCDRLECMAELTPERLWPVLERILYQWHSARRTA